MNLSKTWLSLGASSREVSLPYNVFFNTEFQLFDIFKMVYMNVEW